MSSPGWFRVYGAGINVTVFARGPREALHGVAGRYRVSALLLCVEPSRAVLP